VRQCRSVSSSASGLRHCLVPGIRTNCWRQDSTCVFVCKYHSPLSSLTDIDTGITGIIRNPLYDCPLTQADYEGFVYLKAQTYPLRWRSITDESNWTGYCERTHPAPAFLFPTVNWAVRGEPQQPDSRYDVYFSRVQWKARPIDY